MPTTDLVLGLTGPSGAPYGVRLLEVLLLAGRVVHLAMSPAAAEVLKTEMDRTVRLGWFQPIDLMGAEAAERLRPTLANLHYHHFQNFTAGIASGSFRTAGMAVCPCSMGTVAGVA